MNVQLSEVVDVLFAEFAKINNSTLKGEALIEQLERTKAINSVAKHIVEAGRLGLDAQKALPDMHCGAKIPAMLRIDKE